MAVVPTGTESRPLRRLKDTLEASSAFTDWAAPFGRVHLVGETIDPENPLARPYAIVGFVPEEGWAATTLDESGGATFHFKDSGSVGLLLFADVDPEDTEEEQVLTFTNATGAIMAELGELAGGGSGAFAFHTVTRTDGPWLVAEDEHADEAKYILSKYRFEYRGFPLA